MRFENQAFERTTITLDYNEFVNCTIKDCTVIYAGGPYSLVTCKIDGEIRLNLLESAHRTLIFMSWLRSLENGQQLMEGMLQAAPPSTGMKLN